MIELLHRKSIAAALGITVRTLERWHKANNAPPRIRLGGQWRYPREQFDAWIKEASACPQNATKRDIARQTAPMV